ncbi:hypothetical protein GCM10023333_14790 [Ferrimonas pelagia]|uniref:Uncharacterized protein n=2 Tax=Ferrimonas pelagia TaxID=1177826 RepID=A0ABP9ER14_9GAMM
MVKTVGYTIYISDEAMIAALAEQAEKVCAPLNFKFDGEKEAGVVPTTIGEDSGIRVQPHMPEGSAYGLVQCQD